MGLHFLQCVPVPYEHSQSDFFTLRLHCHHHSGCLVSYPSLCQHLLRVFYAQETITYMGKWCPECLQEKMFSWWFPLLGAEVFPTCPMNTFFLPQQLPRSLTFIWKVSFLIVFLLLSQLLKQFQNFVCQCFSSLVCLLSRESLPHLLHWSPCWF